MYMFSFYDQKDLNLVVNDGVKINELAETLLSGSKVLLQCRPETNRNDQVIFSDKCVIYADTRDLAGHNDAAAVLPYKEVRSIGVENPGGLMGESQLRLDFKGGKSITFKFKGKADVAALGKAVLAVIG
jgi:hypothetical protein